MYLTKLIWYILISIIVIACNNDNNVQQPGGGEVNYSVVSLGIQSGIENQQFHVINSESEYSDLFSILTIDGVIPNPDFSASTLIGIFSGYEGAICDEVATLSIESIKEVNNSLVVSIIYTDPGVICLGAQASYGPYIMIEIEKTIEPISISIVNDI